MQGLAIGTYIGWFLLLEERYRSSLAGCLELPRLGWGSKDHMNMGILQTTVSGILL